MVAKSYQTLEQLCEPYIKNGRFYVKVRAKSGNEREVRWYSEAEYKRMYPGEEIAAKAMRTQKETLGFGKGYIWIYIGQLDEDANDWFKLSPARYTRWWGWYSTSDEEPLENLPEGFSAYKLDWDKVGNADGSVKAEKTIEDVMNSIWYAEIHDNSDFVGNIGDKVEAFVSIQKVITSEGFYGTSTMYIMRDTDGNQYLWSTSTNKNWAKGSEHYIRGTVKSFNTFKGVRQTVLTRVKEVD